MDAIVAQAREAEGRLHADLHRFRSMAQQAEKQLQRTKAQREYVPVRIFSVCSVGFQEDACHDDVSERSFDHPSNTCDHCRTIAAGQATTQQMMTSASERYVFLQSLRDYIAALCDCLQDKTAIIEELEEHLRSTRHVLPRHASSQAHRSLAQFSILFSQHVCFPYIYCTALCPGRSAPAAPTSASTCS